MKLYILYRKKSANDLSKVLLEKACQKLGVTYFPVAIEEFNFANPGFALEEGDALYRIATGSRASMIERFLLTQAKNIVTLYATSQDAFFYSDEISLYQYHGLQTPPTVVISTNEKSVLTDAAAAVGGYPLIIKQLGKSHGQGVHKIESFTELQQKVSECSQEKFPLVAKKYIPHKKHARLIVLGGQVVASISYLAPENDFRTNVGTPVVQPEKFSSAIEALAIEAVKVSRWEFGGVDILLEEGTDNFYLAEVNFPCFFPRAEKASGIPISEYLVAYLQKKSSH